MLKKFEGEKRKQLLFLGGAIALVVGGGLLITQLLGGGEQQQQQQKPPAIETPPPKQIEEESFKKEYGERLATLEKQLEAMRKRQEQQPFPSTSPSPSEQVGQAPPVPPPPPTPTGQTGAPTQYPPVPPPPSQPPPPPQGQQTQQPIRPIDLIALEKQEGKTKQDKEKKEEEVKVEKPTRPRAIIPSGAFVRGLLLSGLDAPTGGKAQTSPHPVLIRLVDKAILPNLYKSDIKDCFVIGSGYGDLSAERAYIRLEAISCVKKDKTVVERKISGYVSGEDGKVGLLGRVVTKQGQILARLLAAGFIEGIARIFQQSATNVVVSPQGTLSTIDPKQVVRAGVAGGFSEGARVLVEQYKKLADEMYPVVEINAGRQVDLVFLQSFDLEGEAGEQVIKPRQGLNTPPPDPSAPIP